jgi:hypothetical protein
MRGLAIIGFFAIFITIISIGCAASIDPAPVVPDSPGSLTNSIDPEPCAQCSHRYSWGLFEISIDPATLEADVVPMRIAEGHLNAVRFLEVYPCDRCITLTKVILIEPGRFDVDVQLRHPFVGKHFYTGFDVHGIVMFDPSYTFEASGLCFPDPEAEGTGALLNPDGYMSLFNPVDYPPGVEQWPAWEYQIGRLATQDMPVSTLNPYKSFQTDTPRHNFGCSTCDTQTYQIRFPEAGPVRFGYAIDASWAPPSQDPPDVPDDFPLEANMPEPYFVSMTVIANTLWSQQGMAGGGDIRFLLKVYDHQDPRLVDDGGTIHGFRWEIDGMTGWDAISPIGWSEGTDSIGHWASYLFHEAPVPDMPGLHRCVIAVDDEQTGIKGFRERAYVVTEVYVNEGESCWSPGVMISDIPNESYDAHLNNARCTFVDDDGDFHLFYLDFNWRIHHLVYNMGVASDEIIVPDDEGFNVNALPGVDGEAHLVYTDDPDRNGGNIVYRKIESDGTVGDAVILSSVGTSDQFQPAVAVASDGQILVVWMRGGSANRTLCSAWFNGNQWLPERALDNCNLPASWINPTLVADSLNTFHIIYSDSCPANLYYMQFAGNDTTARECIACSGDYLSTQAFASIDDDDRIYITFEDDRTKARRGFFSTRDPETGQWSTPLDTVGYNHTNNRYQNAPVPGDRIAIVWTDHRDGTRGLYSKILDFNAAEDEIQGIPDDEVDAAFSELKNQTRLCVDSNGTLHLVWSDHRSEDHWQLFYSTCTP